jgi:hypothetical protein
MTCRDPLTLALAILGVLWSRGPSTVRQVQDAERAAPHRYTPCSAAADRDGEAPWRATSRTARTSARPGLRLKRSAAAD